MYELPNCSIYLRYHFDISSITFNLGVTRGSQEDR